MKEIRYCPYCGGCHLAYRNYRYWNICRDCRMKFSMADSRQLREAPTKKAEKNDTIPTT